MSLFSFNIATEGVRTGNRHLATLGHSRYIVEVVITPSRGGGGGSTHQQGYRPERHLPYYPTYGLIHIEFQGKEENFLFYAVGRLFDVDITVSLTRQDGLPISSKDDAIIEVLLKNMNSLNTEDKQISKEAIIDVILNGIKSESKPEFVVKGIR